MQSPAWKALTLMTFLFVSACGPEKDAPPSVSRDDTPSPTTSKSRASGTTVNTADDKAVPPFGPVVSTKSGAHHCNGIVLGKEAVLVPSHCVEGIQVSFPTHPQIKVLGLERLDPGVVGVETLVRVRIQAPLGVPLVPIDASRIARPEVLPSAYKLNLVFDFGTTKRDLPCFVVTYNPGSAAGYHCQTSPGHSGALVLDRDGAPLAIHLGRKDGLGYGLLLATVLSRPTSNPPPFGEQK